MPRVPKLFNPSVACPACQHPNDEDFNFCQRCGYKRQFRVSGTLDCPKLRYPVNEKDIAHRIHELSDTRRSSRYAKQKSASELELSFLSSLETPKNLSTALPADVVAFLVLKDQGGRTIIHDPYCSSAGNSKAICGRCPKRLAYGTVDSLIGKIRALFVEAGRGGEWHSLLGVGNPATDRSVKNYLADVREEQLKAHITPRQFFYQIWRYYRVVVGSFAIILTGKRSSSV